MNKSWRSPAQIAALRRVCHVKELRFFIDNASDAQIHELYLYSQTLQNNIQPSMRFD